MFGQLVQDRSQATRIARGQPLHRGRPTRRDVLGQVMIAVGIGDNQETKTPFQAIVDADTTLIIGGTDTDSSPKQVTADRKQL